MLRLQKRQNRNSYTLKKVYSLFLYRKINNATAMIGISGPIGVLADVIPMTDPFVLHLRLP
jgi:hypothetical protein